MDRKRASQANFLKKAAEGKVSHATAEHAVALKDEPSVRGIYRISGLPMFVFYTEFHMI